MEPDSRAVCIVCVGAVAERPTLTAVSHDVGRVYDVEDEQGQFIMITLCSVGARGTPGDRGPEPSLGPCLSKAARDGKGRRRGPKGQRVGGEDRLLIITEPAQSTIQITHPG